MTLKLEHKNNARIVNATHSLVRALAYRCKKKKEIKHLVNHLEVLLLYYKSEYYKGQSAISDSFYDDLEEMLQIINPESRVLQTIGAKI